MGKAAVASPQSLEGLRAEPGVHVLTASTPAEWADQVSRLLDDERLRRQFGSAGRRYVEEHHRWETCLEPFGQLLGLPRVSAPRRSLLRRPPGTSFLEPSRTDRLDPRSVHEFCR